MGEGGGGGTSKDSFWKRDLSALGPLGAEANMSLNGITDRGSFEDSFASRVLIAPRAC